MYDDIPVRPLSRKLVESTLIRECDKSMIDFGCKDYDSDSMIISKNLSINNGIKTNDFLKPEGILVCKENGEEDPEDETIAKPQSLLSISMTTPSPSQQNLSDKLLTKIKLLGILRRHKISLCVQKELYDRAYQAQILCGFDWGFGANPYRGQTKVIKLILKKNFCPT